MIRWAQCEYGAIMPGICERSWNCVQKIALSRLAINSVRTPLLGRPFIIFTIVAVTIWHLAAYNFRALEAFL